MSNEDQQSVNGHFPPDWEAEVKTQIRRFLSDSNCTFLGELEDCTDEIFQETVKRYVRYVKDNDGASIHKPKAYIRKIARNLCLDFVNERKKKLENEDRLSSALECGEGSSPVESIYDERNQPEQILLSKESRDRIFSLIGQLPQPLQNVIRFKAEGAQLREIARRTSMPLPQVSKCLHEGQEQLRQLLHQ